MATKSAKPTTTGPSSAFLSSLYIYNPTLGQTDNTVHEQLIFHSSPQPSTTSPKPQPVDASQELHKQLRAIGLAQGIVEFARAFSPYEPVQEVRTQKGFSVPLEVEKGWWILAVSSVFW
jgi:First Longin domain of INTU, CCZ1 and HPS4